MSNRTTYKILAVAILAALAPVCIMLMRSVLYASTNTITVNNTTDPASTSKNGFCTLREAINNANSPGTDTTGGDCAVGTGNDTINFNVSGTITLTSNLPNLANILTIDGTGQTITVDGASSFTILSVNPAAEVVLNNLSMMHGISSGETGGGAVTNAGVLTVSKCAFSSNNASLTAGGGISNSGMLAVTNSTFSTNIGGNNGGGISNTGTANINNSTFTLNSATFGGGIGNTGSVTVTNCTFSQNSATDGGAIENSFGGTLTVTNSTLYFNSGSGAGGGIDNSGTVTVKNSTIAVNSAPASQGGGIINRLGDVANISNSILSANSGGNCLAVGAIGNGGFNVSDDATCNFGTSTAANGKTIGDNINPVLDSLRNNGGPTKTIALDPTSPAIDAVPIANCPPTDQRGVSRPDIEDSTRLNSACDIGAFETSAIIVNTLSDEATPSDHLCSLREAIKNANSKSDTTGGDCATGTGGDSIFFSVSGTITLSSGLPAIGNTLTINGSGQAITINGANSFGVLALKRE